MYSTVSVDGFIADENDQPGPLFDWLEVAGRAGYYDQAHFGHDFRTFTA